MKLCNARVNFGGADQPRLGRKEPNMIIIGCDYHPASNRLRLSIRALVNGTNGNWGTARKRSSSTVSSKCAEKKCGLGWKPVGMRAGLSGYSPSCSLNCGSGMQPRSAANGCANRLSRRMVVGDERTIARVLGIPPQHEGMSLEEIAAHDALWRNAALAKGFDSIVLMSPRTFAKFKA